MLAASVESKTRQSVAGALSASLPWTTFLPMDEHAEFFEALTATAAACVEVDTFEPLAHLIDGWRATADSTPTRTGDDLKKRFALGPGSQDQAAQGQLTNALRERIARPTRTDE